MGRGPYVSGYAGGVGGEAPTLFNPDVILATIEEVRAEERHWLAAGYRLAEQATRLLELVERHGIDPSWQDA